MSHNFFGSFMFRLLFQNRFLENCTFKCVPMHGKATLNGRCALESLTYNENHGNLVKLLPACVDAVHFCKLCVLSITSSL